MPMALGSFAGGFAEAFRKSRQLRMMQDYYESMKEYHAKLGKYYDSRSAYYDALRKQAEGNQVNSPGVESGIAGSAKPSMTHGRYDEPSGDVSSKAQEYSKYLQDQGYSKAGAAAILGNWWQENSLKGGGWGGDNKTSAGGFQWHDDPDKGLYRGTGFMNWAGANHLDTSDPMTSLKYLVHDLNTDSQWSNLNKELKSTDDVDSATHSFTTKYEGPRPETANMPNRLGFARTMYGGAETAKGGAPTTATPTTAAPPALSPSGGASVIYKGMRYDTDKDGNIIESTGKKVSQADTGKGVQVASMDDTMGLDEFLKQHPEAAGGVTTQNRPNPIAVPQESSGPLAIPLMPPYPQSTRYPQPGPGRQMPEPQPGNAPITPYDQRGTIPAPITPYVQRGVAPAPITPYDQRGAVPAAPMPARVASYPYPQPYESGFPEPASIPIGGGAGNVLEAPSGTPAANAPAPAVQPTNATVPAPTINSSPIPLVGHYVPTTGNVRGPATPVGYPTSPVPTATTPVPVAPTSNIVLAPSQGPNAGQTVPAPMPPVRPPDQPATAPVATTAPAPVATTAPVSIATTNFDPRTTPYDAPATPAPTSSVTPPPPPDNTPASNAFTLNTQQHDLMYNASADQSDVGPPPAPQPPPQMPREESAPRQQPQPPTWRDDPVNVSPIVDVGPEFAAAQQGPNYQQMLAQSLRDQQDQQNTMQSAKGGAVTRFAAGGGVPTSAMLANPGWQNTPSTYTTGPNVAPLTNQQLYNLQQTVNADPAGPFMGSYSDWLTGAKNSANPAGASRDLSNYYGSFAMPVAPASPVAQPPNTVTRTVAPIGGSTVQMQPSAAPPVTTPTAPKSAPAGSGSNLAPNVVAPNPVTSPIPTTPTPTAYLDPTKKLGYAAGGSVMRYDDGGGVLGDVSGTITGPPPALSGGMQQIPPIYYNPATYSAAGAPVGRGISASSIPTYVAAPVPTFRRGGIVTRYADGGDVDIPEPQASYADETPMPGEPGGGSATPAFNPSQATQVAYNTMTGAGGPRLPSPQAGSRMPSLRAQPTYVDPYSIMEPDQSAQPQPLPKGPPPGTPEIVNPQNPSQPSMGVLGSVISGFQHIVQQSGLDKSNPTQSPVQDQNSLQDQIAVRRDIALRNSGMTDKQFTDTLDRNDPDHQLDLSMRLLGGMEDAYTKFADAGDIEGAMKVSAMIAMKAIDISARYGAQAAKYFRNGDWKTGIEALDNAQGYVPKDTKFQIIKSDDKGNGVAQETDLAGNVLRTFEVNPQMLVAAANGLTSGELPWHAYEAFATKYLPGMKDWMAQEAEQSRAQSYANLPAYGPTTTPDVSPTPTVPTTPNAPTINSSPLPTPAAPQLAPAVMQGPIDIRNQLLAPTGIGNAPGTATPPPTPGGGQDVVNALAPPQVAEAGAGPGAMPQPYGPSFNAPTVNYGIPSPTNRPDTTTAQSATPPAGADQRPQAVAPPPLPVSDTVSNITTAPVADEELSRRAEAIHAQVFGPQGGHFLPNGRVRLAGGETYDPPPRYPLTGDKVHDEQVKGIQAEADKMYQAARNAAGAQALDDERQKVTDMRTGNQALATAFHGRETQLLANQRENFTRQNEAWIEANKEQAAAEAEAVKSEAKRMEPRPGVFRDANGTEMPITGQARTAAVTVFGSPGGDDAKQLHPYLKSNESFQSVVDGIANAWQYNKDFDFARSASMIKTMITDPAFGQQFGKDGKQTPDPDAVTFIHPKGDPGDIRAVVRVRDARDPSGNTFTHFVLTKDTFDDLMHARTEYQAGRKADNAEAEKRAAAEAERNKGASGVGGTISSGAAAIGGAPNAIQRALPDVFPSTAPGHGFTDWWRNPTGANPATAPAESTSIPGAIGGWYNRNVPGANAPPLPSLRPPMPTRGIPAP